MTKIPDEWQESAIDKEYLLQLLNPRFVEIDDLVLFEGHYSPSTLEQWTQSLQEQRSSSERMKLENTINHVHLDDVVSELKLQKEIGEYIRNQWIEILQQQFPLKDFEIKLEATKAGWELQMWTRIKA